MPTFAELSAKKEPLSEQFLNAAKKGDLTTIKILLAGKPELSTVEDNDNRNAWWFAYANHHLDVADALLDLGVRAPDSYYTLCQLREKFYPVDYCTGDVDLLVDRCLSADFDKYTIDTVGLLLHCKDSKLTGIGNDFSRLIFKSNGYNKSTPYVDQLHWFQIRIITSIVNVVKSKKSLALPRCRELINLKDAHGLTLLDHAIKESNFSNVALFLELGADITNSISHVDLWSKERSEQACFFLLTIVYANLSTRFTKNDRSLVHLAGIYNIPALISFCSAAKIPLNSVSQIDSATPLSLVMGSITGNRALTAVASQLLVHGVQPTINQRSMLPNLGVDLYNCFAERMKLLEKSNRQGLSNQATQAADIATLTMALIDTREQHQNLEEKFSLLESKFKLLEATVEGLKLKSQLKQLELELEIEKLKEQVEQLLEEQSEQTTQTTSRSSTATNTQTPPSSFFKK